MKSLLKSLSPFSFEPEIRETAKAHADKVYALSYALTGEELSAEQLTQDAAARVFLKGFDLEAEKEWIVEAYRLYLQKWKGKVLDLKTGRFWQLTPFARSCLTLRVHFNWSPGEIAAAFSLPKEQVLETIAESRSFLLESMPASLAGIQGPPRLKPRAIEPHEGV